LIAGYFDPAFSQPLPLVRVALLLPQITQGWVTLNFLLDTGADLTTLHPLDAHVNVGIPRAALADPKVWPDRLPMHGVGGISECYRWPAHYGFLHDDGTTQTIQGQILIAQMSPDNQTIESLLGWDVLQHFQISLDWAGRRITLQ
jgi:hypothetical protein